MELEEIQNQDIYAALVVIYDQSESVQQMKYMALIDYLNQPDSEKDEPSEGKHEETQEDLNDRVSQASKSEAQEEDYGDDFEGEEHTGRKSEAQEQDIPTE